MDHSSPGTHPEPPSHHQLAPSQLNEGYALNAVSDCHQTVAPEIMIPINMQQQQKRKLVLHNLMLKMIWKKRVLDTREKQSGIEMPSN